MFHGRKKKTILPIEGYTDLTAVFWRLKIASVFLSCLVMSSTAMSESLNLKISSPAFMDNGYIPVKYTCQGSDINPPLMFKNVPNNTESLVLIVEDPDAAGGTFTHWIMWGINPRIEEIKEHDVPQGAKQGMNDFGTNGYGGPCPPYGKAHRYLFKLFAINTVLHINGHITRREIEETIHSHVIARAMFTGLYKRQ